MSNIPEIPSSWMSGAKVSNLSMAGVEIMYGGTGKKKKKLPSKCNIKSKFPEVYEQNCGCCTSCAVLACDDYYYHGPGKPWKPSFKFTYYVQRKMDGIKDMTIDEGSFVLTALKCLKKYGACSAKVWSNTEPVNKKPTKEAYTNGLKGKEINRYSDVVNFYDLKEALSLKRPVVVAMKWVKESYDPKTFILDTWTDEEFEDNPGCHAVVVVGYDDKKKLIELRNSWGKNWGNNGYCYVTYEHFKKNVFYCDSYAVIK